MSDYIDIDFIVPNSNYMERFFTTADKALYGFR